MYFKQQVDFIDRLEISRKVMKRYPNRKPIICEKYKGQDLPDIKRIKYLVSDDMTIGQFINVIKKIIGVKPEEAIYLFIGGKIYQNTANIAHIYAEEKDNDGLLYVKYLKENTFG